LRHNTVQIISAENAAQVQIICIENPVLFMMKIRCFINMSKLNSPRLEELMRFERGDNLKGINKSRTIRLSAVLEKP